MRLLSTLVLCTTLFACLDTKRGSNADDDARAETTTPSTETTSETEVGPEVIDACFGIDCDDGDPCTYDSCFEGVCASTPLVGAAAPAEPPECEIDADCDDGDASTIDQCIHRTDECGASTWAYCDHIKPTPCNDNDVDCSDGNPCTLDGCDATLGCVHAPVGEGLCDARCSTANLIELSALTSGAVPMDAQVTTRGNATVLSATACPTAGPCLVPLGLHDEGATIEVLGDDTPRCLVLTDITFQCEPLLDGVDYLVWGAAVARGPTVDGLDLVGFCLDTSGQAPLGRYQATLEVEGEVLVRFEVSIEATPAGKTMMISNVFAGDLAIRLDLASFAEQQPLIGSGVEGRLHTQLVLPWANAEAETEDIILFSNDNTLVGTIGPLFHTASEGHGALPPAQEDTLPYGRLTLERVSSP